LGNRRAKMD